MAGNPGAGIPGNTGMKSKIRQQPVRNRGRQNNPRYPATSYNLQILIYKIRVREMSV